MKFLNSILLLRKCEHFELAKSILGGILLHGNQVVLYSDDEKRIIECKDDYYDEKVKPLLESFLYNASCALNYWALELYKDRELIMVIHFEDDYVEISEKYYNECYDIIKQLLIKEPLYNEINISKLNSNSDKILVMLNNFELLRSLNEKQSIKIPNSNVDFSYEIYNSIVGIIYPKDIKECFQNLKDGDWQKSNYDNVLFCNCLIYISMGII